MNKALTALCAIVSISACNDHRKNDIQQQVLNGRRRLSRDVARYGMPRPYVWLNSDGLKQRVSGKSLYNPLEAFKETFRKDGHWQATIYGAYAQSISGHWHVEDNLICTLPDGDETAFCSPAWLDKSTNDLVTTKGTRSSIDRLKLITFSVSDIKE